MAASVDLVTTAEVKTFLSITDSDHDTLIGELIDIASEMIEDYCQTHFSSTAVTEKLDGGQEFLITKRAPIISITSITDNDDSSTVTASDYDFYDDSGRVYLTVSQAFFGNASVKWGTGKQRYTIVYQAGYASVPEVVKMAAYLTIESWLKVIPTSNSKGRWTQPNHIEENFNDREMILPEKAMFLLKRYRNMIVG